MQLIMVNTIANHKQLSFHTNLLRDLCNFSNIFSMAQLFGDVPYFSFLTCDPSILAFFFNLQTRTFEGKVSNKIVPTL